MFTLERQPIHPGEILREEFLTPLEISQSELAKALHTSFRAINEIVNEKRGITTEMALKLSRYFGMSAQLWLNLQNEYDLYKTIQKKGNDINVIEHCNKVKVA
jgi:antitoxin HigA-1